MTVMVMVSCPEEMELPCFPTCPCCMLVLMTRLDDDGTMTKSCFALQR